MKLVCSLLLMASLCAIQIDGARLRKKIAEPRPAWAIKQIEIDLKPYQHGITGEQVRATRKMISGLPNGGNAQFVHYRIENNKLIHLTKDRYKNCAVVNHFIEFIEEMMRHVRLPDIEFIGSAWDCFDDPVYLDFLECPVFTICKLKRNHKAVLWPETREAKYKYTVLSEVIEKSKRIPWHKRKNQAYWRGNAMGGSYTPENWDQKIRPRLVMFSFDHPHLVDARLTGDYWTHRDVSAWLKENRYIDTWIHPTQQVGYKYLISVDGNSFASNIYWGLGSGSILLRSRSEHVQWFYGGIQEGKHYVSYNGDCSDLADVLSWLKNNDSKAKQMAEEALRFAKNNLTPEDIALYIYELFHRYADIYSD